MNVARFGVKVVCRKEIQKITGTVVRAFAFIQRRVNRCRLERGNEEVTDTSSRANYKYRGHIAMRQEYIMFYE